MQLAERLARANRDARRRVAASPFRGAKRHGLAVEPEERLKVLPLGSGRFLLVTERIVTEDELLQLGIAPPVQDVPWVDPKPEPPPERHRSTPGPVARKPEPTSDFGRAMAYWRERLGNFDRRMPEHLASWLDEFGLEGVMAAFDRVKANPSPEPKYVRLIRVLREMREGAR